MECDRPAVLPSLKHEAMEFLFLLLPLKLWNCHQKLPWKKWTQSQQHKLRLQLHQQVTTGKDVPWICIVCWMLYSNCLHRHSYHQWIQDHFEVAYLSRKRGCSFNCTYKPENLLRWRIWVQILCMLGECRTDEITCSCNLTYQPESQFCI